jgi:hypothetical protein
VVGVALPRGVRHARDAGVHLWGAEARLWGHEGVTRADLAVVVYPERPQMTRFATGWCGHREPGPR